MTVEFFDHYTDQQHESVAAFLEGWGEKPWDDANVPIGLTLFVKDGGQRAAEFNIYHPRKSHAKRVTVNIEDDAALERLRATLRGIGETLYEPAARNLEAFAAGAMPAENYSEWGGIILYYWEPSELAVSPPAAPAG